MRRRDNIRDEEVVKRLEELLAGASDPRRDGTAFSAFCARLLALKPKAEARFELSLKERLIAEYNAQADAPNWAGNPASKLRNVRRFFNMQNVKRFGLAGVGAIAVIAALFFTLINPRLQMAASTEIARNDPKVQQLMKDYGVEVRQVKLVGGKACVLLTPPEEKLPAMPQALSGRETAMRPGQFFIAYRDPETGEVAQTTGAIAEIDLKTKKVEKLEMLETTQLPLPPLTEEERQKAVEIAKSEPKVKEMITDLAGREVVVKPMPPRKLRLDEDPDEGVKVTPVDPRGEKRANVIFKSDERQDVVTVNLTTGAIEQAVSFSTGSTQGMPAPLTPGQLDKAAEIAKKDPRVEKLVEGMRYKFRLLKLGERETVLILEGTKDHRIYKITVDLENERVKTIEQVEEPVQGLEPTSKFEVFEVQKPGGEITANEKAIFTQMLQEIGEQDQRVNDLLEGDDYEIVEVIRSKPVTDKTETGSVTRVETATVVLEKESAGKRYWITIDLATNTVKSIRTE